jgi:hypothetical protein
MARRPTARDTERVAAARSPQLRRPPALPGDALRMLTRRGLRPSLGRPDLPFPYDISAETANALDELAPCSGTAPALCRVEKELWNVGRVIAEGLLAQHPQLV